MGAVICMVLAGCCFGGPLGGLGVFLILMAIGCMVGSAQEVDNDGK